METPLKNQEHDSQIQSQRSYIRKTGIRRPGDRVSSRWAKTRQILDKFRERPSAFGKQMMNGGGTSFLDGKFETEVIDMKDGRTERKG